MGDSYDTTFKLAAVGAYGFAASSLALLVQFLSADNLPSEALPPLSRLAFTVVPLFALGLALDLICVNQPKNRPVGWVLFVLTAMVIGFAASTFESLFRAYSPVLAQRFWAGMILGITVVIGASVAALLIARRRA